MFVSRVGLTHRVGLAVVSAMVLSAVAAYGQDRTGPPQIINWESPGNLAATNPLGCVAAETVSATDTAADIASGARACLDEREYERMADLLLLANAYATYDTLRVTDRTAHAAVIALVADRFVDVSRRERRRVLRAAEKLRGDEKRIGALCATMAAAGPPHYRPTYMIAHGLMSFPGAPKQSPLREIDTVAGWRKVLVEFVKCTGVLKIEAPPSDIASLADEPAAAPASTYRPKPPFRDQLRSGGEGPEMVEVPAGRFRMGCVSGRRCLDSEQPVHEVTIPAPFALSMHEVTFEDYSRFTDLNIVDDPGWGHRDRPVINVSWDDAKEYVAWLSSETGAQYRLPSEAEWEYAARAGSETKYSWGNDIGLNRANCRDRCGDPWRRLSPTSSFGPNAWGLHDMHGNASEWVEDCWNPDYSGAPSDGSAWLGGNCAVRVFRGGSLFDSPRHLRAAKRFRLLPDLRDHQVGFRVARTLTP